VVKDVKSFFLLFFIFLLSFSVCYRINDLDLSAYGRIHPWLALIITTLRSSMGDFSLINTYYGFDETSTQNGEVVFKHSIFVVYLTFIVFIMSTIALFMILMNFIIAVISNSYEKIIKFAVAHDYRQKVELICEREGLFTDNDLNNDEYFPEYIIVRK
jgi:hypothetical protein